MRQRPRGNGTRDSKARHICAQCSSSIARGKCQRRSSQLNFPEIIAEMLSRLDMCSVVRIQFGYCSTYYNPLASYFSVRSLEYGYPADLKMV